MCLSNNFLNFGHLRSAFSLETGNELNDQRKADDVMGRQLICSASLPIIVIALSFVELSKVFDCEKGIAKQLKILKVIGDNRLRQRRSFVFAAILLIIRHSCQSFYVILLNLALR